MEESTMIKESIIMKTEWTIIKVIAFTSQSNSLIFL